MVKKKKKILIIEDDKILANMYAVKFEKEGYDVVETQNGIEGLNSAKTINPDVVLLDVILPEMDGFAILIELKKEENTRKIPIVLLTNLGQQGDIEKGKSLGATDYLTKSDITPSEVIERIKNILDKK